MYKVDAFTDKKVDAYFFTFEYQEVCVIFFVDQKPLDDKSWYNEIIYKNRSELKIKSGQKQTMHDMHPAKIRQEIMKRGRLL